MFVFSLKANTIKKAGATALALILATTAGYFILSKMNSTEKEVSASGVSYKAQTNEERVKFLTGFGWQVEEDPLEVSEVIIPEEFDETYTQYNEIQKKQQLDLEKYKGERVKKWTYEILNYPSMENSDGIIRANLLIYDGLIIGGDVCSIEKDGFMHGFSSQEK